MMMKSFLCTAGLLGLLEIARGSSTTHVVPLAQEEHKKRGLLHRHLHDCSCNSTADAGGNRRHRRNLAEAALAMFERRLSDSNIQDLIDGLRNSATATEQEEPEPATPVVGETTTSEAKIANIASDEQVLAVQVAGILEGAKKDLGEVAVYTAHYVEANNELTAIVNQDVVVDIINAIFDFIVDLIQLVIGVIQAIVSLIINTIVTLINLVVGVIVAIFRFIKDIIRSIINKILGVFNADSAATTTDGSLSFFPNSDSDVADDTKTVPALQSIYETLVLGVESIGFAEISQLVVENSALLDGAVEFGLTTAPLVLMEFIGVSTTNAILCAIGATESVVDGECPTTTTTNSTLSQESVCTACEAAAEIDPNKNI